MEDDYGCDEDFSEEINEDREEENALISEYLSNLL